MDGEIQTLEKIEKIKSTNEKLQLIKDNMTKELEEYLRLSLGDEILNVATKTIEKALRIESRVKHKDIGAQVQWWLEKSSPQSSLLQFSGLQESKEKAGFNDFKTLFEELKDSRGKDAQEKIKIFFEKCEPIDAKWFARCLVKDLACGMSLKTVNKAFKKLDLKLMEVFELSLCDTIDCSKPEAMEKNIDNILANNTKLWVEPKYDGIRLVVRNCLLQKNIDTEAVSRNGKRIESVNLVINEFNKCFGNVHIELDGELIAKDFQTLMTQVHRKNNLSNTLPREFMVFDILTYDGNDVTYLTYEERRKILENLFSKFESEVIKLIKNREAKTTENIIDVFKKSVSGGYEGIILKNNSLYTKDRENWYKMKPITEASLEIISLNREGKGRWAGMISSFDVTDASGTVVSKVGSGMNDETIKHVNKGNIAEWLGKIVEIRYDCVTKPNKLGKRSLRFPRFIKFRFDLNKPDKL